MPLASFQNPSLTPAGERAADVLHGRLDAAGIASVSAGSRGFTLNVASPDADRAREVVRRAIEEEGLEAVLLGRDGRVVDG